MPRPVELVGRKRLPTSRIERLYQRLLKRGPSIVWRLEQMKRRVTPEQHVVLGHADVRLYLDALIESEGSYFGAINVLAAVLGIDVSETQKREWFTEHDEGVEDAETGVAL